MTSTQTQTDLQYLDAIVQRYDVEDATFAVRVFGEGPALFFIHGYPLHGYTWRKIIPALQVHYTCYVVDLPGLGDSGWNAGTDFRFGAQARRLNVLLGKLDVAQCAIVAHDTGATIARLLALQAPGRITKLAIINTEIPFHRPPWIELYQWAAKIPLHELIFRMLLGSRWFVTSSMCLGQFYSDKAMLDDAANVAPYMNPLTASPRRLRGMIDYLKGIDWKAVDCMAAEHRNIQAEILLLWGEDDQTFPVALAEDMTRQFASHCRLVRIAHASLLPHEEKPQSVLRHLLPFLLRANI